MFIVNFLLDFLKGKNRVRNIALQEFEEIQSLVDAKVSNLSIKELSELLRDRLNAFDFEGFTIEGRRLISQTKEQLLDYYEIDAIARKWLFHEGLKGSKIYSEFYAYLLNERADEKFWFSFLRRVKDLLNQKGGEMGAADV